MGASPREIPIAGGLYRIFIGALLGLPLVFALAFMPLLNYEWREYRQAGRAVAINYVIDDLMRITRHARLEYERTVSLLGNAEMIGPADRGFIDSQRQNIDSAWGGVLDAVPRHDISGAEEILKRVQGIRFALWEMRATTDIALLKPVAERPPKLAETWISTMRQLLAHVEELLDLSAREAAFSDGMAGRLLDTKLMAWKLRGSVWTEISALEPIITRAQTPTRQEAETIVASAARTALAWEYLSRAVSGFQDRPFTNVMVAARNGYFEDFGRIRDHILQVVQKGGVPDVSKQAYLAVSIRTMESIGNVLDTAMALTEQQALKSRDKARSNLIVLTGVLAAGLLLAVLVFVVVRWRAIAAPDRLQTVFDSAADAIITIDEHGIIESVNPSAERMFGYSRAEMIGHNVSMLMPEPDRRLHDGYISLYIRTGVAGIIGKQRQVLACRKNGEQFHIDLSVGELAADGRRRFTGIARDITMQKTAEKALSNLLVLQSALLETIPGMIFFKDLDGRYLGCNRAYEDLIGMNREALKGKTLLDVAAMPLADREALHAEELQVMKEKGRKHIHKRIRCADGRLRDFLYSITSFELSDGRSGGIVGVLADITELRDAERRAREVETRLREITDGVPGAVFQWRIGASGGGSLEFVSKGVEALWGVTREAAERDADSLHGAILEGDRKRMMESVRESTATLKRWGCEFRIRSRAGGELKWIWAEAVPHHREDGEIVLNGYWIDITERKRIEAALKESEERFRQFSESINVGLWILDLNPRRVTYVNRAFTHMSGLEADEVYRDPGPRIDVVHEDDRQAVRLAFEEWLEGEPSSCLEIDYRIVRPDGKMRWIHDHGVKLQDGNGRTFRILGISEDITERKLAEEAIKAMNRALERKAGELAIVNRELEAFAYSVSHDLRAPLRHVDGYLSLLQKRVSPLLDETSQRYVATISKATERMASLIDNLLAFSRMSRTELNKTVVPLNRLIKDVIGELKTETENRHIDWIVKPLPDIFGDAALFRQAFFNLIENAVKYTRPRPQARIEIGCINDDRNEAIIFVSDNGVGFDMKYVDKLFGVFQRLHRAEEFEGTGIGLANVARIVQRHGGRVWAVGDKDKGATFYVAIPLEKKDK